MPSRADICVTCGPPPCTTTGLIPADCSSAMSSANDAASAGALHRGAAVLHDDHLAVVLRMNGSASSSVRAFATVRSRICGGRSASSSRRVLPVDADVVVGQVAAERRGSCPGRRPTATAMRHLRLLHRGARGRAERVGRRSTRAGSRRRRPPATSPIQTSIVAGSTATPGRADRLEDPAGVRIAAEHRGLHQRRVGDRRFATRERRARRAAPATSTSITWVTPSPSAISWRGERRADLRDRAGERGPTPACSGRPADRRPRRSRTAAPCRSCSCSRRP